MFATALFRLCEHEYTFQSLKVHGPLCNNEEGKQKVKIRTVSVEKAKRSSWKHLYPC